MYLDLQKNADFKPQAIPLGLKIGVNYLIDYLHQIKDIGVNHIALNLRFNSMNVEDTLSVLSTNVLSQFHSNKKEEIAL